MIVLKIIGIVILVVVAIVIVTGLTILSDPDTYR